MESATPIVILSLMAIGLIFTFYHARKQWKESKEQENKKLIRTTRNQRDLIGRRLK